MGITFNSGNFETEVLKSDQTVLVDFYADWCVPCKMMAPVVDELAKEYEGKVKVGKLNVEESSDIAGNYSVMSIPTFIVFKDGKAVDKIVGGVSKEELENKIK